MNKDLDEKLALIETLAVEIYAMVDRVKAEKPSEGTQNAPKRDWANVGKQQDPEYDSLTDDSGQPIPF